MTLDHGKTVTQHIIVFLFCSQIKTLDVNRSLRAGYSAASYRLRVVQQIPSIPSSPPPENTILLPVTVSTNLTILDAMPDSHDIHIPA